MNSDGGFLQAGARFSPPALGFSPLEVSKHAGVAGRSHRLRHTQAKNQLLSGVPLETVSLLPGHKCWLSRRSTTPGSSLNDRP
jgi:hypothetical protein